MQVILIGFPSGLSGKNASSLIKPSINESVLEEHLYIYLVSHDGFSCSLQLTITLLKEDTDPDKAQYNKYFYAGGLVEYVKWLNGDKV